MAEYCWMTFAQVIRLPKFTQFYGLHMPSLQLINLLKKIAETVVAAT
jgi:hypothetical protein